MQQVTKVGQLQRDVARRFVALRPPEEPPADFCRRMGISAQVFDNYEKGRNGMALSKLVEVARRLSGAEMLWVLTGRELDASESASASYRRGALDAIRRTLDEIEAIRDELSSGRAASPDAVLRAEQASRRAQPPEERSAEG